MRPNPPATHRQCTIVPTQRHLFAVSPTPPIVNFPLPKAAVSHKHKRRTSKVKLREEAEWSRCFDVRSSSAYLLMCNYFSTGWESHGEVFCAMLRHARCEMVVCKALLPTGRRSAYELEASEQHVPSARSLLQERHYCPPC